MLADGKRGGNVNVGVHVGSLIHQHTAVGAEVFPAAAFVDLKIATDNELLI